MFAESSFSGLYDIGDWDVSGATALWGYVCLCVGCKTACIDCQDRQSLLNSLPPFLRMFYYSPFNGNLGKWAVNGVYEMDEMFAGATEFEGQGLANWETTSLQYMPSMVRSEGIVLSQA